MAITIREMDAADRAIWAKLRSELWPDGSLESHLTELEDFLRRGNFWGFVAEAADRAVAGFAEVAVRDYANGCNSRPVAFLEGIWVRPAFRRQRVGAQLLETAERFLAARGFDELGSDALIDNRASHAAHAAWGFAETERVVYFRKRLAQAGR
jgi:aminoglycoside 6'-N-acetyltransferase I